MANIVITGAARGIGLELTRQYLAAGDRVFALVRDPAKALPLQALAAASGGRLTIHSCDVTDTASVNAGVASIGDANIDVLLNVAGVIGTAAPELESTDWAAFDAALDVPVSYTHLTLPTILRV